MEENEILPFAATWMKRSDIIILKSKRERQILHHVSYMWNLEYDTNESIYEAKTDSKTQKRGLWLSKGKKDERGNGLGVWG